MLLRVAFYDSFCFEIGIRITSEKPNSNVALDSKVNIYRNLKKNQTCLSRSTFPHTIKNKPKNLQKPQLAKDMAEGYHELY